MSRLRSHRRRYNFDMVYANQGLKRAEKIMTRPKRAAESLIMPRRARYGHSKRQQTGGVYSVDWFQNKKTGLPEAVCLLLFQNEKIFCAAVDSLRHFYLWEIIGDE